MTLSKLLPGPKTMPTLDLAMTMALSLLMKEMALDLPGAYLELQVSFAIFALGMRLWFFLGVAWWSRRLYSISLYTFRFVGLEGQRPFLTWNGNELAGS